MEEGEGAPASASSALERALDLPSAVPGHAPELAACRLESADAGVRLLVLGYVRVSTIEQTEGFGPAVQEAAIKAYCQKHKLDEPEIVFESKSGESLLERAEIRDAIVRAEEAQTLGEQAHIVFYRLDRLSRDLIDQEVTVGRAMKSGFRLHSTFQSESDTLDPAYMGDPARTLIRQVFGIFNQFEKANIQMRLDGGLRAKGRTGASTGGRYPFGYYGADHDIAKHPDEAPAVRRCFALAGQGLDLASTAAALAREFPGQCSHWSKSYVKRVLDRKDLYVFGWYKSRMGVTPVKRQDLVIVTEEEYSKAMGGDGTWAEPGREPGGSVNWDLMTDSLPLGAVALLINRPVVWCQRMIAEKSLGMKWEKQKPFVSRLAARVLEVEAKRVSAIV